MCDLLINVILHLSFITKQTQQLNRQLFPLKTHKTSNNFSTSIKPFQLRFQRKFSLSRKSFPYYSINSASVATTQTIVFILRSLKIENTSANNIILVLFEHCKVSRTIVKRQLRPTRTHFTATGRNKIPQQEKNKKKKKKKRKLVSQSSLLLHNICFGSFSAVKFLQVQGEHGHFWSAVLERMHNGCCVLKRGGLGMHSNSEMHCYVYSLYFYWKWKSAVKYKIYFNKRVPWRVNVKKYSSASNHIYT